MFYIGPTVGAKCSVRLTWDVFVLDLNRQLGTPSHWLPVDSCKEGQKGALAAVCTLTLKSASKKHQKLCTSVSEHRVWHSEGGKRELCLVSIFSFWQRSFPSPLCVISRLEQATRVFLENLPKVRTPFPTFKALFKLLPHSKHLKAHLIIKRSAFKTFKPLGSIYSTLNARHGNCIKQP